MSAGKKFQIFHHIDQKTIDSMFNEYSPVFILTTGRSGSKFIHNILSRQSELQSYHEAFPTLQYFSNYAFHNQGNPDILESMFQAARMELVLEAYNNNKIYVESNQCLSFFAKAIAKTFKKAKFIHLLRHPGSFVRSAIMKGWHQNDTIWEAGRVKIHDYQIWDSLNRIEKLAWVWKVTNESIKDFSLEIDKQALMTIKLEDISKEPDKIDQMLRFIGIDVVSGSHDLRIQIHTKTNELVIHSNEPENMKKVSDFPFYNFWNDEEKNSLSSFTKELAKYYSYEL